MANNSPSSEKEILKKYYATFCNVLKHEDGLLPYLVEKHIISWDDLDEIKSKNTDDKGPTLLKHISSPLEANNTQEFYGLLEIMINHGKINTQEFAKKIKHECLSNSKNLEVMLAKLEKAKANNETLKVSFTTALFCGSSGVGKTTLLRKLNKEKQNRHHISTGLPESKHTISVKTTAVIKSTEESHWIDLDYDSMTTYLNKYLSNLKTQPDLDNSFHVSQAPFLSASATLSSKDSTTKTKEVRADLWNPAVVDIDIAKADSSNIPSLGDVWNIINFLDTGGQAEFANLVSSSIALTFIVFDLSKSLDSLVPIQHNIYRDPSFILYDLDSTNLEFIKGLMVSSEKKNIMPLKIKNIQREVDGNDSKICYVGTHALNVSEEEIQEIDSRLSHIAHELGMQRSFWSSPNPHLKRLFPIDMFPDDNVQELNIIEDIRDNIQKQVEKQDYYEVPITWFIFLLKIQHKLCSINMPYISYQEAVDVWMDQKASESELVTKSEGQHESVSQESFDVHDVLLFFHFVGMLFYYHQVEGMQDFVFINRQWLVDKLTKLVDIKFTNCYSKKDISAEDIEKFTIEGRLNINIIKNLKLDLQGIHPLHFINLLNHLNIIAPIDMKQNDYFMPCALPNFNQFTDLDEIYGIIQHAPLLVGFKNGPMHHGFFCHLIAELFKNLPTGWKLPYISTSKIQHVYSNLITFPTASAHTISLCYKIGYLEIQVRHHHSHSHSHPTIIHCNIQCVLDRVLRKLSDRFQLNKEQLCYGFYCNCKEMQHFAKLENLTSQIEYMHCGYGAFELTNDHKVWVQGVEKKAATDLEMEHVSSKSYPDLREWKFVDTVKVNHLSSHDEKINYIKDFPVAVFTVISDKQSHDSYFPTVPNRKIKKSCDYYTKVRMPIPYSDHHILELSKSNNVIKLLCIKKIGTQFEKILLEILNSEPLYMEDLCFLSNNYTNVFLLFIRPVPIENEYKQIVKAEDITSFEEADLETCSIETKADVLKTSCKILLEKSLDKKEFGKPLEYTLKVEQKTKEQKTKYVVEESSQKPAYIRTMCHVSNQLALSDTAHPNWNEVQVTEARYPDYHGHLLLGLPVAGFTIMPLVKSIYPFLQDSGNKYYQVTVPFNPNEYYFFRMHENVPPCPHPAQIHLLCIKNDPNDPKSNRIRLVLGGRLLTRTEIEYYFQTNTNEKTCRRVDGAVKILYFIENIDINKGNWSKIEKENYDFGVPQDAHPNMTNIQLFEAWITGQKERIMTEFISAILSCFIIPQ